ncbi:hypothetical protein A5700_02350 [Mycobacterium sp. E1214]|nr:hypothetical protein A5700_02350 [Mycobacterium sp. E1214]OBH23533.1 hypothetical protein A5693_10615 [Mycobacterium sp. E1319]
MDVVLMGVTSVDELACAAISEAAAIVEAEWIRLRRPGMPVRHPAGELPAARALPRHTATAIGTIAPRRTASTRSRVSRGRWPAAPIWARQRSPPRRQGFSRIDERG